MGAALTGSLVAPRLRMAAAVTGPDHRRAGLDARRRADGGAVQSDAVGGKERRGGRHRPRLDGVGGAGAGSRALRWAWPLAARAVLLARRGPGAGGGAAEPSAAGAGHSAGARAVASEAGQRLPVSAVPAGPSQALVAAATRRETRAQAV